MRFNSVTLAAALGTTAWLSAAPAGAIVGGRAGGPGEASAVMVLTDRGGVCSGVVLAPDVVLTAAHCVAAGAQIRVHWREGGQPVLRETAAIVRHPDYRANAVAERARSIDLALIRMREPLPARFGAAVLAARRAEVQAAITVAGFGLAAEGDVASMGAWRSAVLPLTEPHGPSRVLYWLSDGQGGGDSQGRGACQGDSGGPAFDAQGAVTGVISWTTGRAGGKCGALTQAVILEPQRGWIDATLARWGRAAQWR